MKVILILLVCIVAPLRMAAARLSCPNVPHISTRSVCSNACGTKVLYDHCIDAMRSGGIDPSPSHTEETTVYAILAANQTWDSYRDTLKALSFQLQQNKSLSYADGEAYMGCQDDYVAASNSISIIMNGCLENCYFEKLVSMYLEGMASLENCRDRMLAPWMKAPLLYPKVERDRNKVLMAYLLGKLLAGL
uniref:Uncharacterized protein n=1 Tax=Avena sativa TaxID=4498 RepID=A0ACD5WEU7_AVESA